MKKACYFLLSAMLCFNYANAQENIKDYANYDFVPGDKVLFDDDFASASKGEFPNTWTLQAGQALVAEKSGKPFMAITEGSYGKVAPNIKSQKYLGDSFTVEFDYLFIVGDERPVIVTLIEANGDIHELHFGNSVNTGYFEPDLKGSTAFGEADKGIHRGALVYKNGQLKCYINQTRSLVVPNCKFKPVRLEFAGGGSEEGYTYFTNVRIAEGGDMNMWNKLSKDGKVITHGIYFDVNKSVLKPQSMGVLNEVAKMMKEHPELKLEIGGHTDSDGDDASNMALSQKRADAVKDQLVKMGIAADKLTTKGYGETKPVGENNTAQGKANNRRVEFVKK